MNNIILTLLVVFIAVIESIVRLNLGIYNIEISLVLILSGALYFSGKRKNAVAVLIVGSIILDLFSPYRFGLFLLFGTFSLILMRIFSSRSLDIHHPMVNFGIFIVLVLSYNIFQVASDPLLNIFIVVLLLNAVFGSVISFIFFAIFKKDKNKLEVSDNVNLR